MPASTPLVTTLREGIVTALAAVTAGSTYHNTLTGTDQVKKGLYATPPRKALPCVMVGRAALTNEHGEPLGSYRRTAVFTMVCWAPATSADPEERLTAAEKLAQDVAVCIETAINAPTGSLFSSCISGKVDAVDFEGAEGDVAGWATALLTFSIVYESRSGAGL